MRSHRRAAEILEFGEPVGEEARPRGCRGLEITSEVKAGEPIFILPTAAVRPKSRSSSGLTLKRKTPRKHGA
jgi:hypothetical protein